MNRKIYLWILVFAVLCISIGVFLFTRSLNTEKENELGIPDIPSSFNQAQIEGAMLLKSVIHWYHQHRDKDNISSYFHELSGIADKISNIFEFSIVITDEDYNVDGAVDDDMNISEGGGNLRDDLLKISGGSDSFSKYFGELDKFIVSPQDRNDTWLTFYFVMGAKVPEIPKEGMRDMMKYNLLGVWHDNKFFVTTFQTRMPLYYFFDPTIDDYNDAVNYYSDNLPLSGMNVDVSPYTSSIDDGIKLVVTVTILDKGEFYKNNSNTV